MQVCAKFGVFSSYGFRETLSGHDRQTNGRTDMAKLIFLIALIKNIYFIGSQMSPPVTYMYDYQKLPYIGQISI